jgi:hypothetical protein
MSTKDRASNIFSHPSWKEIQSMLRQIDNKSQFMKNLSAQ